MSVPSMRLPFFWAEVINAGQLGTQAQRGMLIGQATSATYVGVPRLLSSAEHAASLFGRGSPLHRMAMRAFKAHPGGLWYSIGIADASASTASAWTVTFVCSEATEAGTIRFWLGSDKIDLGVIRGDAAANLAERLADLLPSASDYPVTATHDAGITTITFRSKGTVGNALRVARDTSMDLPAGVTSVTIAHSVTGATDPTLDATITALAPDRYHKIALYLDGLGEDLAVDMDDRWGYLRHQYGHVFSAVAGVAAEGDIPGYTAMLAAMVAAESPYAHWTSAKLPSTCRAPAYEVAAALAAVAMKSDEEAPGLKIGTLALPDCRGPESSDFTPAQKNQLLLYGGTTFSTSGGYLVVDQCNTTRWSNADGSRNNAYLDAPKYWLAEYAVDSLHSTMSAQYARCRLVSDSDGQIPPMCATPSAVAASIRSWYRGLCNRGLAQDPDTFDAAITVTRPEDDRNRLDAYVPAHLADNFEILAPTLAFT